MPTVKVTVKKEQNIKSVCLVLFNINSSFLFSVSFTGLCLSIDYFYMFNSMSSTFFPDLISVQEIYIFGLVPRRKSQNERREIFFNQIGNPSKTLTNILHFSTLAKRLEIFKLPRSCLIPLFAYIKRRKRVEVKLKCCSFYKYPQLLFMWTIFFSLKMCVHGLSIPCCQKNLL